MAKLFDESRQRAVSELVQSFAQANGVDEATAANWLAVRASAIQEITQLVSTLTPQQAAQTQALVQQFGWAHYRDQVLSAVLSPSATAILDSTWNEMGGVTGRPSRVWSTRARRR